MNDRSLSNFTLFIHWILFDRIIFYFPDLPFVASSFHKGIPQHVCLSIFLFLSLERINYGLLDQDSQGYSNRSWDGEVRVRLLLSVIWVGADVIFL